MRRTARQAVGRPACDSGGGRPAALLQDRGVVRVQATLTVEGMPDLGRRAESECRAVRLAEPCCPASVGDGLTRPTGLVAAINEWL